MATMEQLGNDINSVLSPSTSGIQTGRSSTTYTQPKQLLSTLETDMQKLTNGLTDISATLYKTSEYAHRLVAIDKSKEFELGNKKIDDFFVDKMKSGQALTSKDYEAWIEWKTNFFEEMVANSKLPEDAKEYGDYYKEHFIKPAIDKYYSDKANLSRNYLSTLRGEKIVKFKREVEDSGYNYTGDDFYFAVSQLERLGVDNAQEIISSQIATTFNSEWHSQMYNGVNSETFKPYLEAIMSGKMSVDQAFKAKFNDIYGNQVVIDDNGNYVKVNENLSDTAFNAMIKSYQGWINAFNKKAESPTLGTLIPQLNKSIDVNRSSSADAKAAFDKATEEMNVLYALCKSGENKACSKYATMRDGQYTDLQLKIKHIETLEQAYEDFNASPSYISNKEFSYSVTAVNPLTGKETSIKKTIGKEDVYNYISSRLVKNYDTAIKTGDMGSANEVAMKAKILFKDGNVSGGIVSKLSDAIKSFSSGDFAYSDFAKSPNQFISQLISAVAFNQTGDGYRYSGSAWLNDKMLSRVNGYYSDLLVRRENGEKGLTDGKITQLLMAYTNSERAKAKYITLTDEQKRTLNTAVGEADADVDTFVSWYLAGDGKFGVGTASVALKYVLSKDRTYGNEGALRDELQKSLKVMDDKAVPIFTNRTVLFVPDAVVSLGADKYKELFYYALNKDIQKYNDMSKETIHLRDLTDDNVQIRQTMINGQVVTFLDIFDESGRRLHTAEVTEDEWLKALNELEKQKIDNP